MGVPLGRRVLFRLGNSEWLDGLVRAWPFARRVADRRARRYVAGPTLEDAIHIAGKVTLEGLTASVDYLGWYVDEEHAVEEATAQYLRLCAALTSLQRDVYVSLDLTHFGLKSSLESCCQQVRRIADALPHGARIQVGGEAARETDQVLAAVLKLAEAGVPVMATLQANLRRSNRDAERLAAQRIPVRLCKGAYIESLADAYPWGAQTDAAYARLAYRLAEREVPMALGTHDPVLLKQLLPVIPEADIEVLLGVRVKETRQLAPGRRIRVYVPYGEGWFRYYLHRLAEARGA